MVTDIRFDDDGRWEIESRAGSWGDRVLRAINDRLRDASRPLTQTVEVVSSSAARAGDRWVATIVYTHSAVRGGLGLSRDLTSPPRQLNPGGRGDSGYAVRRL